MKRLIILLLTLAIGLTLPAAAKKRPVDSIRFPALNPLQSPEVLRAATANGIQLRLIPSDKLPLVNLEIMLRGGSVYDPADKAGLASVTAQLLRIGGAGDLKSDQVDQLLDSQGIDISISADDDMFTVSLSCLQDVFPRALDVLAKMLTQPGFDPDKLAEIKAQASSAISRRNDQPFQVQEREFNTLIYGRESPFGRVMEYEHVEAIGLEDVRSCWQTFFAPANMLCGAVGPLSIDGLQAEFGRALGGWQHATKLPAYPRAAERDYGFKVAFAEKAGMNQSYIAVGQFGSIFDRAENPKILVFNQIFSQSMDSRLFNRVRTRMGLTYGVGGGIMTQKLYPGKTYFTTFTKAESTLDAIRAIFDEIAIIRREPVTPAELDAAKDYFLNSFVFRYSTPQQIISNELVNEFYNLGADYLKQLQEGIRTVSIADVQQVAQRYLDADRMIVFVLGPQGADAKLGELGQLKKIDIAIPAPKLKEIIPAATPESLARGKALIAAAMKKNYSGYARVRSAASEGSLKLATPPLSIGMKSLELYPDKSRQEMSMPFGKFEIVVNGDRGVQKAMGQVQPMPPEQIAKSRFDEFFRIFSKPEGYAFQYLKEETVGDQLYDVIYMTAAGSWAKLYVNRRSALIEIVDKVESMMGREGLARKVLSGYRTIEGVAVPMKTVVSMEGKTVMELVLTDVRFNVPADPKQFEIQ